MGFFQFAGNDRKSHHRCLYDGDGNRVAELNAAGQVEERAYYLPWGGERGNQEIELTDYGYTGQMKEGDIYFYNARWPKVPETQWSGIDPAIGRFMQAGTIVPMATQGTQAFDRYAYVNNNPLMLKGVVSARHKQ